MRFPMISLLLLLLAIPGLTQEVPIEPSSSIAIYNIGSDLYAPLDQFATGLGIATSWKADRSAVKLTIGAKALTLIPGAIVALNAQGRRFCLPAPPVMRDNGLQVPLWPVVAALGGKRNDTTDGSFATLGAKSALLIALTPPVPAVTPEGITADALHEPRLPLDALAAGNGFTVKARPYLEGFAKLAKPVRPALNGIATSQPIKLLGHVPVVGSFVTLCQDAVGSINSTIGLAQRLVDLDTELLVPIRDGCTAARAVQATPDAAAILAARPKWVAAAAAAEKQLALYTTAGKHVNGVLWRINLIDAKLAAIRKSYPQVTGKLSLAPLRNTSSDLLVTIDAQRWQLRTLQAYFTRVLDASAPLQPGT